jgi:hypothetical protein
MVSTTVETDNPEAELKPGLDILAPIEDKYVSYFHTLNTNSSFPYRRQFKLSVVLGIDRPNLSDLFINAFLFLN